jgi:ribosome-associated protein
VHGPDPQDRLLEGLAHVGVERSDRGGDRLRGDAQVLRTDTVEPLCKVPQRRGTACAHVGEDRRDRRGGGLDVHLGAREGREQLAAGQGATAQVDPGDHGSQSTDRPRGRRRPVDAATRSGPTPGPGVRETVLMSTPPPSPDDVTPISDESIRLGQFLKLAGLAESGAQARELLDDGVVSVNGEAEFRRGRQLRRGDVVVVDQPNGPVRSVVG